VAVTYTSGIWLVREGHEADFVAAWSDFAQWIAGWPGAQELRLVRDLDQPHRFLSFAPWDSFDEQRAWKESPEFRERIGRVREHVEDFTPSTYELVLTVRPGP
jgi:heme-degrading monooxygenase HmoA